MRTGLTVVVLAIAAVGCYRPDLAPCSVTCTDVCPGEQTCGDDGYCHAEGDTTSCTSAQVAIRALTAGVHHACAIDDTGRLLCWGNNRNGQVGLDLVVERALIATAIDGPDGPLGWTAVDAGDYHTCGVQNGKLACWGYDSSGQSGGTDNSGVITPQIPMDSGTGWLTVSTGSLFSCGIRADGADRDLYCWGSDTSAQLADGDGDSTGPELRLANLTNDGETVVDWVEVNAGDHHACARRASGEIYCWGGNDEGKVGDGTREEKRRPTRVVVDALPVGERVFRSVAAGSQASCAVSATGALYCWGVNGYLQLGSAEVEQTSVPRRVGTGSDWSAVQVGMVSACGVRADGLWCWGNGEAGALGNGGWASHPTPRRVTGIDGPALLAVGDDVACAAPAVGGVLCWGENEHGELGNSNTSTKYTPTLLAPADGKWTAVAPALDHTCGIHDGQVRCWGWNAEGALDGRQSEGVAVPTVVAVPAGAGVRAREIGVSLYSSCAIMGDGAAARPWCWGYDSNGQVGTGNPHVYRTPVAIGVAGVWSALTVASRSASALAGSSRMVWGDPSGYGLGNGDDMTQVNTPTAGDALAWQALSLGHQFGCGIEMGSRALRCWGSDEYRQQGDGATDSPGMTPHVLPPGLAFASLGVGWDGHHACAITMAGALYCWGRNDYGQVGTGAGVETTIHTPTAVPSSEGVWTAVSAGWLHTCGIREHDLYCWGNNRYAQIGTGDEDLSSDANTRIGAAGEWTAVAAGSGHTCAVRAGNLYCWGTNLHGQVGDGTQAQPAPGPVILP